MKKKNYWFAVVTMVLCLGVMATGIYAAKTAMLKLGGTLGFNMHNCLVEVSGSISNVAQKQTDGSYIKTTKTISNAIMGGEKSDTSVTTTELDLGALEFYTGEDMIFELSFKNLSSHSVIASFGIEYTNTKVSQVESGSYDELPATKIISTGGRTTLNFALHLADETAVMNGFAFTITAEFEELTYVKDTAGRNCIVMGKDETTGTELLWYPFAYSASGEEGTFTSFDPTNDITSGSYYFISKYILMDSMWGQYNYTNETYGTDYGTESFVQPIVNGTGSGSIYEKYDMSNYTLYKAITKRDLPSEIFEFEGYHGQTSVAKNQTMWILNLNEIYLFASSTDRIAETLTNSSIWWLRTTTVSNSNDDISVCVINANGDGGLQYAYSEYGIRPAFQITIE